MSQVLGSNFSHLKEHDTQLLRLGVLAEKYFAEDPNTCLLKLRQLCEGLAQFLASAVGVYMSAAEAQFDLLSRLKDHGILPREIHQLFSEVRRTGNAATHQLSGDHRTALTALKVAWQISVWFHRTLKNPQFKSGPFLPPQPPTDKAHDLQVELAALTQAYDQQKAAHLEKVELLELAQAQLQTAKHEQAIWEQLAMEAEAAKAALVQSLELKQAQAAVQEASVTKALVQASVLAAEKVVLDEAETRKIIDSQLQEAGWLADSVELRYAKGTRPEKGKNLAIAEWPTEHGPVDYVLFVGLVPLAVVEAKRQAVNVSGTLQQAQRYSRGFKPCPETVMHAENWGANAEFRVPFVFATNSRPYVKQVETHSGTWFRDLRRPENHGRALDGWYSPEGLTALLGQDVGEAHQQLESEPFNYGFELREYQKAAILSAEEAISHGQRFILLAMATGTGKTKTCIALIYRLLKTKRFRRILFLVDRSALGEQAVNAFKDTRMESAQTFANIFGIKELDEQTVDSETAVHIATVQGMVQRVLNPGEDTAPPTVDQYDCIIVDECHRGYLLDRELSETEQTFRSFDDYVSKYRRVLDRFDAFKIGLTATPALHTSEIFGKPVYTYSYREAVIDGYLIDHEPPFNIATELNQNGIVWKQGEDVSVYKNEADQVELFQAPDEIHLEVQEFNKRVITESFNQVVCQYLAGQLDPWSPQKTLIFCANNDHADLVVKLLKAAFKEQYGSVEDDAVLKITGSADKPLQLIRRYKNEAFPNVAVTVDLLTTGVDVPSICNLVFLRRVNSRILFDQMLGRATRLCDDTGKETFRIYDAVRMYEAIQAMTAMKPVVVQPQISFTQLLQELTSVTGEEAQALVRDQLVAKLQRKKRHLSEKAAQDFETRAGMTPDQFITELRTLSLDQIASWFVGHQGLGEILDRKNDGPSQPTFVSHHEDRLMEVTRDYGNAKKPEDYIQEFKSFIVAQGNKLPALMTVITKPSELTRQQLREVMLALESSGFSETGLTTAYREMTNQDIAARIIGYIRQAALGDALIPFDQRVDQALAQILGSRAWTPPQQQWLKRIAAQTKANSIVDRHAMEKDLVFTEAGGFKRADQVFNGELQKVLSTFNDTLWKLPA